ncbi:hypothetical protein PENTCL1PPCAC_10123, partial [Pristionchus entomophagus]
MVEWLRSGAVVECDNGENIACFPLLVAKNETAVELARAVGWIRHDLEWAGMRINEEKSQWEVSQAGNESALHSRCLQQTAVRMEEEDSRCTEVAPSERSELIYWVSRLEGGISREIVCEEMEFDWTLTADASAVALGWILEGREESRGAKNLSEAQRRCSSTFRELLGVELAVGSVAPRVNGDRILIRCDNQGAISILRKGRERGAMLEDLERELSRAGRTDLMGVARSALEGCVASSTLKNYSGADRARRRLAAACGLEEEADLSLCLFVLDAMAKKRSKSTVATAIAAFGYSRGEDPKESRFGSILKAAMRTAARSVPVSSHPKATREEVESILRWGTREGAGAADLRIAVITLFSFGTLLRPSEAVALKREDVSEKSGVGEKLILG